MSSLYSFKMNEDYLEHHGIEGQKWGVKNGPPYPIESGDHSAAEKKHMGYFARKKAAKEEEKQKKQAEDALKKERTEKLHKEFEIIDSIHDQIQKSPEMIDLANEFVDEYEKLAQEYGIESFRIKLEDAIEKIVMDEEFYNTVQSKFFENNAEVKKQWDESIERIEKLRTS